MEFIQQLLNVRKCALIKRGTRELPPRRSINTTLSRTVGKLSRSPLTDPCLLVMQRKIEFISCRAILRKAPNFCLHFIHIFAAIFSTFIQFFLYGLSLIHFRPLFHIQFTTFGYLLAYFSTICFFCSHLAHRLDNFNIFTTSIQLFNCVKQKHFDVGSECFYPLLGVVLRRCLLRFGMKK